MDNVNLSVQFIGGFYSGEGWFYSQILKTGFMQFQIGIKTHARDTFLLQQIKNTLKYGYISKRKDGYVDYLIHKYADILKFIEVVGPYLAGYKKEQFNEWCKVLMDYKAQKGHISHPTHKRRNKSL
ncbi:MAG: LAGLIDADG family homing endonuclease [Candidatus Zapsychrus exili]|nr:LAGLIDADG family homing endonuclease [Candidatus Zapsychrus exili]